MLRETANVDAREEGVPAGIAIRALREDGSAEPGGEPCYAAIARLMADAYPIVGVTTAEAMTQVTGRIAAHAGDAETSWIVAQRAGEIVGAMRLFDYTMNLRGRDVLAGGVGSVAVGLPHKKQGIARALIAWYLDAYRARGAAFAVLHPFRPDFYRAMGFGYGTPVHRYRIAPAALRADGARGTVRLLDAQDVDALFVCSERVRAHTNGLIRKHLAMTGRALAEPSSRWVGVEDVDGTLRAYMQTSVELGPGGTLNANELIVRDLQAEDEPYRAALLGYLRAQRDQFARIVFETQDAAFHLAADDPRDGSDRVVAPPGTHRVAETGLGMMYRVLDVEAALRSLRPSDERLVLRLEIGEGLAGTAAGVRTFVFGPNGAPAAEPDAAPDATLRIGIADLSSLIAGSLRVRDAVRHRLAVVAPAAMAQRVGWALDADQPPQCTTRF
ncbi:MAG: hypothetical protein NVS3B7_17800 [Candidatus Elarobacter sp.]